MGFVMGVLVISALLSVIFGRRIGALVATGVLGMAAVGVALCSIAFLWFLVANGFWSTPKTDSNTVYPQYYSGTRPITPAYGSQPAPRDVPVTQATTQPAPTAEAGQAQASGTPAPGPTIGVAMSGTDQVEQQRLGLATGYGAIITDVAPGGPAAQAGLAPSDILAAMDGIPISDQNSLPQYEAQKGAGLPITLSAYRVVRGTVYHWFPVVRPQ